MQKNRYFQGWFPKNADLLERDTGWERHNRVNVVRGFESRNIVKNPEQSSGHWSRRQDSMGPAIFAGSNSK